jgi:hypothetical protein
MNRRRMARIGVAATLLLLLAATTGGAAPSQGFSLNLPRPALLQPSFPPVRLTRPVPFHPVMPPLRIVVPRPQQPAKTRDVKPFSSAHDVRRSVITPAPFQLRGEGSSILELQ